MEKSYIAPRIYSPFATSYILWQIATAFGRWSNVDVTNGVYIAAFDYSGFDRAQIDHAILKILVIVVLGT